MTNATPRVGLCGAELPLDLVRAQLTGADADMMEIDPREQPSVDLIVAAGPSGSDLFADAQAAAIAQDAPAVIIERGGIGGRGFVELEASIALLDPDGPCFTCLERRVAAGHGDADVDFESDPTVDRIVGAIAGREIRQLLDTDDPTVGRVIELPYHERILLPVPGCETCDPTWDTRWGPVEDGSMRSLEAALEAAERALDDRIGILREVGESASVPLPYYLVSLADTTGLSDGEVPAQAAGVSEDWNQALMKGLGEGLERYAGAIYRTDTLRREHPGRIDQAIAPETCVRPDDWAPVDQPMYWIPGTRLASGADCWLPADLVLFPPPSTIVRPPITTGLALENTQADAVLGGLLEVIERDAAMIAWYSTFEPLGLDIDDPAFVALCKRLRVEDLDVSPVLLTQDVDVPVVGVAVHRSDPWPRFAVGSAAGFDPVAAATDALREATQNWLELDQMGRQQAQANAGRIAQYASDPGQAKDFVTPDVHIDVADIGDDPPDSTEKGRDRLVSAVEAAGMTPAVSWLTPRDLAELGFHAVRVVVPEAQPLLLNTTYFGSRARAVPQAMGFAPRLERAPHPFP